MIACSVVFPIAHGGGGGGGFGVSAKRSSHINPRGAGGSSAMENSTVFGALARRWKQETLFESSVQRMTEHPAYKAIVAMGPSVVPLILRELKAETDFWFPALHKLTNANPVPAEDAGKVDAMAQCWLKWGRDNGYEF